MSEADKDSAETNIPKAAYLEFRMVKDDSDEIVNEKTARFVNRFRRAMSCLSISADAIGRPAAASEAVVVKKKAENGLAGDIVKSAHMGRDQLGEPEIDFTLTDDGRQNSRRLRAKSRTDEWATASHGHHSRRRTLFRAAQSTARLTTPTARFTGHFTDKEAQDLASVLQNPLRAPLKIVSSEDVDPTLGKDSIRSGIRASIAAVVFVSLFMLAYYWIAGLTANVALVTNIIILLGVMCCIGTTLTLPGIAGVVLTIGMAVDANVLIYERLREEIAKGKSLRGAIDAGYARAFGTIFDSHVTTLISSIILIFMGTGEIKGFGVTLTIGVAASLFTALVVTRLIFNFLLDRNLLKSLPMLHIIKSAKVNFMKIATPLFVITWLFIFVSLGYGIFDRGSKLFGVDFRGGDSTTFSFAQKPDVDQIRAAITAIGEKDPQIQYQKDVSSGNGIVARDDLERLGGKSGADARRQNFRRPRFAASGQPASRRGRRQWKSGNRRSSPR